MCGTAQRVSPHSPIMRLLPTWQRRGRRLSDAAIALDAVSPRRKRICPPKDDLLSPAWRRFFWRAWEPCQQVPRRASMSLALPTATSSPAAGHPPAGKRARRQCNRQLGWKVVTHGQPSGLRPCTELRLGHADEGGPSVPKRTNGKPSKPRPNTSKPGN